jgi:hypothetical protein
VKIFKGILEEVNQKGIHKIKTLVYSPYSQQYYMVSSVEVNKIKLKINETTIFKADDQGNIIDYNEVYSVRPAQHSKVIKNLVEEILTETDFKKYKKDMNYV